MSLSKSTLSIVSSEILNSAITFSRNSSATRVNNVGKVEILSADTIRQDFKSSGDNVGEKLGWLLEESSINLCLQSEDLSTTWSVASSSQTNNTTIGADSKESPDGNTKGDDLKGSSNGTGIVSVRQPINYNTDSKYTISVFAKKDSLDYLEISNKDDATTGMTFSQVFNLNTGATGSSGGTVSSSGMQEFVNGWYRCYVTFTAVSASNDEIYFKARPDDSVSTTYSTVTNSGIGIWGTQVEEKAYMTSYIPTTTTTTTRAADLAEISDTYNMWNWNIGLTIIVDGTPLNTTENVAPIYHYQNSANTNTITLLSDGKIKVITNSVSQLSNDPFDTGKSLIKDVNFRNALSIKANRLHLAQNGVLSDNLPDTSITVPMSSSTDTLKFFHGTGLNSGSGWLKSVKVYSSILSDANLKVSSTISEDNLDSVTGDSGSVADGTITTNKLAANSITTIELSDNSVTIDKLNVSDGTSGQALSTDGEGTLSFATVVSDTSGTSMGGNLSGTISNATIVDDAIVTSMIATNAVTSSEIVDDAIITAKIADGAITSAKIGVDVIVAGDIAANSITTSEISDNSVTIDKLNVSDGTSGQLLSTDGSGTLSFTAPPSSGKTVTESSSDPTITDNPSDGLGALHLNTTSGELFALTDATTDQNSWVNIGGGSGNIIYTPPPPFGGLGGGTISGYNTGGHMISAIEKYSLVSNGSSSVVGNLTSGRSGASASSSTTHGYTCGGWDVTVGGGYAYAIDKFSFSTHGTASAVGDLSTGNNASSGNTSSTHGYVTGGDAGGLTSTIQKYSFSVDGNTVLYSGVLTVGRSYASSGSSGTHGYNSTGYTSSSNFTAHIDKFSFSSEGNATDHGDMGLIRYGGAGYSTLDHGYVSGGRTNGNDYLNTIAKYSFDNGNGSIDHGDLVIPRYYPTSTSSVTDGYSTAGFKSGGYASNDIEKFAFASASGATSIGSLTAGKYLCMGHQV